MIFYKRCFISLDEERGAEVIFSRGNMDYNLVRCLARGLSEHPLHFRIEHESPIILNTKSMPSWLKNPMGWYLNIGVSQDQWDALLELIATFCQTHDFLFELYDPRLMPKQH